MAKISKHLAGRTAAALFACAIALSKITPGDLCAQIAISINPANLNDPRIVHLNPAAARVARPNAYLGLKLIYPGVLDNNAFAVKSSLFNISSAHFAGAEIGAAAHGLFFTTPLYSEYRFGIVAAKSFGARLHAGLELALHTRRYALENFEGVDINDPVFRNGASVTAFDPGFGLLWQLSEMIHFGASLKHFTRPNLSLGETAFRQPLETILGLGFNKRFARIDLGAHYWQNNFRPLFGAEIFDEGIGRLRLGFALNNALLEGQLALRSNASLFYNFSLPTSDLGLVSAGSHEFGLAYAFRSSGRREGDSDLLSLVAIPDTLVFRPGEAAPFTLRLRSSQDIQYVMDLKLTGAPPGVRLRPTQAKISSQDEALVSLQSEATLPAGHYEVVLEGRSGSKRSETKLALRIISVPKLFARVTSTIDTVVITESREIREELPLIPRVFFAINSTQLARSRYDLISGAQRSKFFREVREINSAYRNLLNIIAERVRANRNVTVTIRGFSPGAPLENDPAGLSLRRAQYVREYMSQNLGVPANQLQVEVGKPEIEEAASHDHLRLEELQRVDLLVAPEYEEEIFAPIFSEKKEWDAVPKRCGFVVHEVLPGTVLQDWQLAILAGNDTLKVFDGSASLPDTIWWNWQEGGGQRAIFWQEVKFSLALRDHWAQAFRTPWQTITSRQIQTQPKQIERIPLILFAFDDYQLDETSKRLRAKLRQIAEKLRADPLAKCELHGYTDAIGERDHNMQLSQRRAQNVLNELARLGVSAARMSVKGFGEENAFANNELPEGRMLNRRVEAYIRHVEKMSAK